MDSSRHRHGLKFSVGTTGGAARVSAHWPRFVPAFSLKKDCGSNKAAVDYFLRIHVSY